MITLRGLARLAEDYAEDLEQPVAPLRIGDRVIDTDKQPVLMGVVNLSRESTYRQSIAVDLRSAVRKAHVQVIEGADLVDVGAESTRSTAGLIGSGAQQEALLPVIERLVDDGIAVSIESYDTSVVRAGLKAGACMLNLTGSDHDEEMFTMAAEHHASVVLCHLLGPNARSLDGTQVDTDPVPRMLERFGTRIDRARELGVTNLAIDPGIGFTLPLADQRARAGYQTTLLLHSFRLRRLGVPVAHALPHAFDIFSDQFRSGEGFFAVLAHLGGTGIYRTHEVPLVRSVLDALGAFTAAEPTRLTERGPRPGQRSSTPTRGDYGPPKVAGPRRAPGVRTLR